MSIMWEDVSDEAWGAHEAAEEIFVLAYRAENKTRDCPEIKGLKYKAMFLKAAQEALGQIFYNLYAGGNNV